MKLEWLKNYEAKEYEKINRSDRDLSQGKITVKEAYPYFNKKIKTPCAVATVANLWVQLSLFETVFFELVPVDKYELFEALNITQSDFDRLIELGKTGKIRFMLKTFPDEYRQFDYLDPIFSELDPPISYALDDSRITQQDITRERVIFEEYASHKVAPYLASEDISEIFVNKHYFYGLFNIAYEMKLNNLLDARQQIYDLMLVDPELAIDLLHLYDRILRPSTDPLALKYNATSLVNLENFNLAKFKSFFSANSSSIQSDLFDRALPYEIGKIIIDTAYPNLKTFDGYLELADCYKSNHLYSLLQAFYEGVTVNDYDAIKGNTDELKLVMENLWKDAKYIPVLKKEVDFFASLSIGAIGQIVGGTGYSGILAFLGFLVLDKVLTPQFSDLAVKIGCQNYTLAIFNFNKQYKKFEFH
jgi:hypothetical protein